MCLLPMCAKVLGQLISAAAETVDMCSTTARQATDVNDLTLNMTRPADSTLPISCTCLIKSHQSNIALPISRQITISNNQLFNHERCSDATVRHIYLKQCNHTHGTCSDASYSGISTLLQSKFNVDVTTNWLIVSFTWNKCSVLGSGATNLAHIDIRGKTTVTHFYYIINEVTFHTYLNVYNKVEGLMITVKLMHVAFIFSSN